MAPAIGSRERSSYGASGEQTSTTSQVRGRMSADPSPQGDAFHAVLASASCSLKSPGPPVLACDRRNAVQHLERRLQSDAGLTEKFLECFASFISNEANLRRILLPMLSTAKIGSARSCESLARLLLSVGQTQSTVAAGLLEKLPEYVGEVESGSLPLPPLMDSIPRLILSQFRWLEFLVDSQTLTEKILEVLSICPLGLKKEIITFLPEFVVDGDHEMVVQSLEIMLQDDLQLIVPVLDAFSNLNLEDSLFQQVVALALSSLRSADVEDLPLVVKFLLQSASATNVKQVVQQLRENLHFMTVTDVRATKPDRKMKGKSTTTNCEALVLEAIRSGMRFQNLILEASLKEIRSIEGEKNHKVVDIWLLLIIHANGGPHRKIAEQILLKKIILGDIGELVLRQCIQGRGDSLQDYFQTLVSVSESCLRSKELAARQFGMNAYVLLFQEFVDPYYRQEVLGALISHTGSGNSHEIGSALETLLLFATKQAPDLLPISSFINGVLDHLEGFQDNHLHQVYQIFSQLAVTAWSSGGSSGSSVGSELLIIVRKQDTPQTHLTCFRGGWLCHQHYPGWLIIGTPVDDAIDQITNSEPTYRRMGIIGAVGLASCLGKVEVDIYHGNSQGSTEETLSLLQMTLEACKSSPLSRGFFYDELASQVETALLGTPILDWTSKHISEFEGAFLGDLDGGELQTPYDFGVLEGDLWMNLDDDMSPIVLNVLPILMRDHHSARQALIYLPANFRLLASAERVTNQESLANIDALLGCPMLLPKHQFLNEESWKKLSTHQKELGCLALFYAINWIRELINAFSTQLDRERDANITQTTREDTITKLFKRMRNLLFLEHCLHQCLESTRISFDPLHFAVDGPTQPRSEPKSEGAAQDVNKSRAGKREKKVSLKRKGRSDVTGTQDGAEANLHGVSVNGQPTIIDAFNKSNGTADVGSSIPAVAQCENSTQPGCATPQATVEREASGKGLDEQRWKFRPLALSSLNILAASQTTEKSCCSDTHAQLPLLRYLLQDLQLKLDWCLDAPSRKLAPWMNAPALPKAPSGLGGMSGIDVLTKLRPLFPSLRKHLDCAIAVLQSDTSQSQVAENRTCDDHWAQEAKAAGNPDDETFAASTIEAAQSLFLVMIRCLSKVLSYPELSMPANGPLLKTFLLAFGNHENMGSDFLPPPVPGSFEEVFCNAYNYLDNLSEAAAAASFTFATELVMVLKALVNCTEAHTDKSNDDPRTQRSSSDRSAAIVPYLRSRLSLSAGRVLGHDWNADDWKNKGDILQQLLRMQIQNSDSPIEQLEELVSSVMPQVPSKGSKVVHGSVPGYPALSSGTFMVWYRVEHEEVLALLNKVVKDCLVQSKSKTLVTDDLVIDLLNRAQQCITLHVSLVKLTKSHDKAPIHAAAVKYGGKFVDTFLKGMDFLKTHYDEHKESINTLVKELQKATRIVQTLCSEAKVCDPSWGLTNWSSFLERKLNLSNQEGVIVEGQKRMPVTCKVPVVKRSMERYVYCIKALLHCTAHGSSFWMGNLKHKDLQGREISSQPYAADDEQFENQASDNDQEDPNNDADEMQET